MKKTKLLLTVIVLASFSLPALSRAEPISWSVDKAHSRVGFSVKHLGINTVHGKFSKYDAEVKADSSGKLKSVGATVYVSSVDTGISDRDAHLRAPDVFNEAAHPTIKVAADKIHWSGNKLSGKASMTIKGKTLPVKFWGQLSGTRTVTENGKQVMRAGYTVSAKINRKDFGIDFGGATELLGMVGETITISLNIETIRPI